MHKVCQHYRSVMPDKVLAGMDDRLIRLGFFKLDILRGHNFHLPCSTIRIYEGV